MRPSDMDEILDRHFAAESAHDLDTALATLTDDVVHDVVGDPTGALHGPAQVAQRYSQLFTDFGHEKVVPVRRLYGSDFLVDESVVHATAVGAPMGLPGRNRAVSFRLLHILEFRDNRISRENVWMDVAALQRQLSDDLPPTE